MPKNLRFLALESCAEVINQGITCAGTDFAIITNNTLNFRARSAQNRGKTPHRQCHLRLLAGVGGECYSPLGLRHKSNKISTGMPARQGVERAGQKGHSGTLYV
jgi:hypothetical protein